MNPARTAVLVLALWPAVALAGRVFEYTDRQGNPHFTDNLWELPAPVRTRYLELIEDEARSKYSVQQIREMKEAGNWPPVELIRPAAQKASGPISEWMGFKLVGSDLETQRAILDEFRFQWDSFFAERRDLEQKVADLVRRVSALEIGVQTEQLNDAVLGRLPGQLQAPEARRLLDEVRAELDAARAAQAALPEKERRLLLGERVYARPGEVGTPEGKFGFGGH